MAMTLLEAAKLFDGDQVRQAIIELYAKNSSVLEFLPFENIAGNALKYNREDTLPNVGFRGVNEAYTEGIGVLNPQTENLFIAGGDLDVDKFILETMGQDQRSVHEAMKIKALAWMWTSKFFKGDSTLDPREPDGLQKRITGAQLVDAGSASGGDALSLSKLDEAIDQVDSPNVILMNRTMIRRLSASTRATGVSGYLTQGIDSFGRRINQYNGIPILDIYKDNVGNDILPFTESNPGGGTAASTSVYVCRMGDGGLVGIQSGSLSARDLGELQTKPVMRTRVEWFSGLAIFHGRAVARLRGIKDAAIVA